MTEQLLLTSHMSIKTTQLSIKSQMWKIVQLNYNKILQLNHNAIPVKTQMYIEPL